MDSTCDLKILINLLVEINLSSHNYKEGNYGDFSYLSSICDQKCLSSHAIKELYAKLLREIL